MMEVPTVYLVEDNQAVRDSLVWMLQRAGMQVEAHSSPAEILEACEPSKLGCLILDLQLPEMTGLELRNRLVEKGCGQPFLIITGHGEVPDATAAMRMGAVDFLEKPLNREHLIERVWHAIDTDLVRRRENESRERVQQRIDALSPREREVLDLVVVGKLTKQIAKQLGVTVKTIEAHRSNITKKMQVGSVAQLVRLVTEHNLFHSTGKKPAPHRSPVASTGERGRFGVVESLN